jgi:pimeloyl-ACP methyl ester carboxylesterase
MAAPRTETTTLCGTELALRRAGSGEPLLFLHGVTGPPGWPPFLERLARRCAVIAPDHPSFGRSPTPPWLEDVGDLALFYLELIEHLELSGVHIVGHCLGGWIALEAAVRATARIKTLTLIAPAGIRVHGQPPADIFVLDRAQLARALYADPALAEQESTAPLTPEQENDAIGNKVAAARLVWQPRLHNPKLGKWLHRIRVPTQILWGDADRIIPPAYAASLRDLIPGARVTLVPGAGHLPHLEKPEPVAQAVLEFAAGAPAES